MEEQEEPEMGPGLGARCALGLSFPEPGFTLFSHSKTALLCPRLGSSPCQGPVAARCMWSGALPAAGAPGTRTCGK